MVLETAFESERTFTQAEFARWLEGHARDVNRYELLNGRIVMNPPSGWPQGEASLSVGAILLSFVRARNLGRVFGADQGFELPSGDTVGPDAAYVSHERWRAATPPVPGAFLRVVPDLAVEVLSPSTASRDRREKKGIYERNGVRESWLVDEIARKVTRLVLEGDRFGAPRDFAEEDRVESVVLAGLAFPAADVLPR